VRQCRRSVSILCLLCALSHLLYVITTDTEVLLGIGNYYIIIVVVDISR